MQPWSGVGKKAVEEEHSAVRGGQQREQTREAAQQQEPAFRAAGCVPAGKGIYHQTPPASHARNNLTPVCGRDKHPTALPTRQPVTLFACCLRRQPTLPCLVAHPTYKHPSLRAGRVQHQILCASILLERFVSTLKAFSNTCDRNRRNGFPQHIPGLLLSLIVTHIDRLALTGRVLLRLGPSGVLIFSKFELCHTSMYHLRAR